MAQGSWLMVHSPSTLCPQPSAISHVAMSLPLHPGDDFFADVLRRRLVAIEVHRIGRAPLRARAEIGRVAEHLRQRHARRDDLRAAAIFLRLNLPAAARQVAHHIAHVFLGDDDLDAHHRLEQHRLRLLGCVLERHRTRDLERHFRRVDVVVRTVVQLDPDVVDRVAGEHAAREGFLDAFVDRLDELLGDRASDDLVLEDVAGARLARMEMNLRVTVLTAAAGLLRVLHLAVGGARQRLLVGDLRLADGCLDVELALQAVDDDLEVQLTHSADDRLPGLLIGVHAEGRILRHQLRQALPELLLIGLGLRLDRQRDHRLGEVHRLEDDRVLLLAQRIAGRYAPQPDRGGDVAGVDFLDLFALVRVHLQQAADPLGALLGRVVDARSGAQHAGVDAEEGELTDERVGHDLERERAERLVVGGGTLDQRFLGLPRVDADDRRHVERRRQEVDHAVEQRLDALVLERRPADHRHERALALVADRAVHARAERRLDFVFGDVFAVEVLLEDLVVGLADLFDQLLAVVLGLFEHPGRNLADDVVGAHGLVLVGDRLHLDEIDYADELVFRADRQLNRDRVGFELGADLIEGAREVRPDAVHLVHEADARHAVLVRLPPDGLRLRLDAGDRVEHRDRAVEDAQRPLDFGSEVDVTGRIDDVDAVIAPETGGRRRRDGDAALLLLLHPVHDRGAFVHLTDLVGDPGVEQDPLGRRRLAGIDVRHDADVPSLG